MEGECILEKSLLNSIIEEKKHIFEEVNDKIWGYAEPGFKENKSAALQIQILKSEGFEITEKIGGISTAFKAVFGESKPVIGILGEYDALPNLSQEANLTEKMSTNTNGWGHGCGHNTLGTAAMQSAVAIKDYMSKIKMKGTIIYFGCPAEEGGSGKAFMTREGCFEECDVCLTWHPYSANIGSTSTLANIKVKYNFHGVSSHAAVSPHLGRSALDAVELMNVGSNYLREHTLPETRIHYAVTNTGGGAPNVVQAEAEVLYVIRAPQNHQVIELLERVNSVAKGAAMMTGTTVDINVLSGCADVLQNKTLDSLIYKNMKEVLPLSYTEEELLYAEKFKAVGAVEEFAMYESIAKKIFGENAKDKLNLPMAQFVFPPMDIKLGSTDVGDVSWNVPTTWFNAACYALGTSVHSWQLVAQGRSSIAHKGMTAAATVIAMTAIDIIENPSIAKKAKEDLVNALNGQSYKSVIPASVKAGSY